MGHDRGTTGQPPLEAARSAWIETFRSRSRRDLKSLWRRSGSPDQTPFIEEPWGLKHRPDWAERGLLIWPRGRQWLRLEFTLHSPEDWNAMRGSTVRLCLSWWAEAMRFWVDGVLVHEGDLFDTACRWPLPAANQAGAPAHLQLELCSPLHDDGALITSELRLEPTQEGDDPDQVQLPEALMLHLECGGDLPSGWPELDPTGSASMAAVASLLNSMPAPPGAVHWIGHAHLDLAWLWPVADTWLAAERTFRSALALIKRNPELRFAHSTPALYAWVQRHRPSLFSEIQAASKAGRWEPINGPWVETDCVLVSTASLWQQFAIGQDVSHALFPEWSHELCWLPDSFGFAAGVPAVAQQAGIRWFCTHKLAWNATTPFPHRLFRWRSRGGGELLALMLAPIGRGGDPLDMLQEQRSWSRATGVETALWIPGVGDHGGGPTEEMLEQMRSWDGHPQALPRESGTVRAYLSALEPLASELPIWQDELYLELHRACATTRPDQKRHNRTLERLLREADLAAALLALRGLPSADRPDWRPLLFQQFHDILPGTSIPEVFDQAEPIWRTARRKARAWRDLQLHRLLATVSESPPAHDWVWLGLQPLAHWSPLVRLPRGHWASADSSLPTQDLSSGGTLVQLPRQCGAVAVALTSAAQPGSGAAKPAAEIRDPVRTEALESGGWLVGNRWFTVELGPQGVLQLRDSLGRAQLSSALRLRRFRDRGEFWDAWDLPEDYREHPLALQPLESLELLEQGPLLTHCCWRFRVGTSPGRLDLRVAADCRWLELRVSVHWRQRHELLRLEAPLAQRACRLAADTSGGVIERPARPANPREQARWEVPVTSWLASQGPGAGGGLAMLLDGPQGVDGSENHLGVSLMRGPTWPDPGADQGWIRQRLALMPLAGDWCRSGVPQAAIAFREPGTSLPMPIETSISLLPALPEALVPISCDLQGPALVMRVLNPGASRVVWTPGNGWQLKRSSELCSRDQLCLMPGELTELELFQSS